MLCTEEEILFAPALSCQREQIFSYWLDIMKMHVDIKVDGCSVSEGQSKGMKPACRTSCCGDLGVKGHRFS